MYIVGIAGTALISLIGQPNTPPSKNVTSAFFLGATDGTLESARYDQIIFVSCQRLSSFSSNSKGTKKEERE